MPLKQLSHVSQLVGIYYLSQMYEQGRVAQSVMCPTAYTCLTVDPGVASLIPVFYTFAKIDHEIVSLAIFFLSTDSRRVVVSYK